MNTTKKTVVRYMLFSVFLSMLVFLASFDTYGADLYWQKDSVMTGMDTFSINVKDNTGLMGFKIMLDYPEDKLDIVEINRGNLLKNGNFTSSIQKDDGYAIVVWNNTTEISGDGCLFSVEYSNTQSAEEIQIRITYSKDDTFNEKWESVNLSEFTFNLFDVESVVIEELTDTTTSNITEEPVKQEESEFVGDGIDYRGLYEALKKIEGIGFDNDEQYVSEFNAVISQIMSGNSLSVKSKAEAGLFFQKVKENAVKQIIIQNNTPEAIKKTIDAVLEEAEAKSIAELPEDIKVEQSRNIMNTLLGGKENNFTDVSDDDVIRIIENVYDGIAQSETVSENTDEASADTTVETIGESEGKQNNNRSVSKTIWVIVSAIIAAACVSVYIYINRRIKERKNEK